MSDSAHLSDDEFFNEIQEAATAASPPLSPHRSQQPSNATTLGKRFHQDSEGSSDEGSEFEPNNNDDGQTSLAGLAGTAVINRNHLEYAKKISAHKRLRTEERQELESFTAVRPISL